MHSVLYTCLNLFYSHTDKPSSKDKMPIHKGNHQETFIGRIMPVFTFYITKVSEISDPWYHLSITPLAKKSSYFT